MCKLYIQNDLYLMDMYDIQNHELGMRRKKLLKLRQMGYDFPNNFRRNAISDDLHNEYDNKKNDELKLLNVEIKVSGRMMNRRIMGKSSFVTLQDMGGVIQLYIVDNMLQQGIYNYFKTWDVGDILGASGKLFKTRTGELSIYCREIYLLTKSLRPLPEKFHKLINQEIRYRKRYLDLIVNDESRNIFKIRSLMILEIRKFMVDHDFIEVETPMMQAIAGGANARPFTTHHNSLGMNMYLRISPELYLKRLVIGGFEKIFEINRNFRNEGISSLHNPEFTMMEIYVSYVDYRYLMFLLENLLCDLSNRVLGSSMLKYGNNTFDFSKPFTQMTMHEAIFHYYPEIKLHNINCLEDAVLTAKFFGIIVNKKWGLGKIQTVIFEKMVERYLVQPTFITQYPTEVSPLARPCDKNSFFSDRFELFISGYEIGNGFSELNDVDEQKIRFMNQLKYDDKGGNNDDIINSYDTDYLIALEHGLPPTAGVGIGIDRLVMLFTNQSSIRNVILFPTLRQKEK